MNERLSDIEKHILNDLCMPVYTRDGSETSHPLVRPLTRQMPNIDSGIPPTEAPPDTVDELAAMQKLAGIGFISMVPIQGHLYDDMLVDITPEGAEVIGKTLTYPVEKD